MVARRSFDESTLTRLRAMPTERALGLLSSLHKDDKTFVPVKDVQTRRWHVSTVRGEFEIIATGTKWFDTHAQQGGGGAIDLTMHLLGLSFVDAVKQLAARERMHGSDRA